ncbi:PREDICTED: uncharacterized protein LOC109585133 [Amphimedon queenslandica]|uniref:RNB domain-containing protein n=2 Tax=Amphimedon queenslandica TaxID=400682 RepID=A0AAN0JI40_AMPQE|nr:PREDICTED: uncharacterized protein LOC109585133 [Amphimedon queenslandica]|eukprot:XP_019856644.1 PREDICTED: uncharacterized protein LOC109585133 [Amphimedon queenslandica]
MAVRQWIPDMHQPALVCTSCFHPADTALYTIGCRRPDIHKSGYYWAIINKGILVPLLDNAHQNGSIYNYPLKEPDTKSLHSSYRESQPSYDDMKLPITTDHYKAKFTALLYYEEQEHIELLKKKCNGHFVLQKCRPPSLNRDEKSYPPHFYCLQGMSSAQIMYATQASDRHVTISIGQHSYAANILSCNYSYIDDKLYICFDDSIRNQSFLEVTAKFDVNHNYFVGLNEGVKRISLKVIRRLIPTPEDFKSRPRDIAINIRRHPYGGIDLDPEQYPALEAILSNQCSAPVLVPGAFGCGKTRLLAVATECFFREHRETGHPSPCRILICCHHQHSADVFMDNYFSKMLSHSWPVKVVRVTSSRHRVSYPGYVQAAHFDNSQYKNENSFLLVTTFGGALTISRRVEPDFFTHILIDEGAQTREPEALSPFLMANENTRIVIAGDHQQVGPQLLVLGKAPQQFGLCVSLLQRLLEKYKSIGDITKRNTPSWNINYRSQADILELPSKLFYNSELRACGRIPYHLKAPYPYVFICSSFTNDIPIDAQCAVEADRLLQAVQLHSDKFKSWELKDTCIMTPSLKQANLIKKLIKTKFNNLEGVNVITSYQMQGQEYRMLFMSTVESLESNGRPFDPLKSFCNPALFNTAITRSKSLVVAVGNPLVLLLSEATMDNLKWCWREFISRCLRNETFKSTPSDRAQFDQVKAQFFDMLKCDNTTDVMELFQKKSYSQNHFTKPSPLPKAPVLTTPSKMHSAQQPSGWSSGTPPSVLYHPTQDRKQPSSQVNQDLPFEKEAAQPWPQLDLPPSLQESKKQLTSSPQEAKMHQSPTKQQSHVFSQRQVKQQQYSAVEQKPHFEIEQQYTYTDKKRKSKQPKSTHTNNALPLSKQTGPKKASAPQTSLSLKKQKGSNMAIQSKVGPPVLQQLPTASPRQQKQSPWRPLEPVVPISLQSTVKPSKSSPAVMRTSQISSEHSEPLQNPRNFILGSYISNKLEETLNSIQSRSTKEAASRNKVPTSEALKTSISMHSFKDHAHRPINKELLAATLTPGNYKEKFHQLLCREEDEHERILREKCNGFYDLKLSSIDKCVKWHFEWYQNKYKLFCTISNTQLNADTIAYAMQASEGIVILHLPTGDLQADILQTKNRSSLYFLLGLETNTGVTQQSNVNVTFILKFSYFDRLHRALDSLPLAVLNRLMPNDPCHFSNVVLNEEDIPPPVSCVHDIVKLEYSQRKALKSIMSCEANKAPVLIIGSFGTGKTQLLARAAYQVLKQNRKNRILICAHHQRSADTFMTNYFSKMIASGWYCGKVVRLMATRDYYAPLNCAKYYATIRDKRFRNGMEKISLIVTTFSTSLHMLGVVPEGFFTHILLDEGAQTREPESVAPLCLADGNTQIVIAGDHKQVGPSLLVLGELAIKNGLSLSLLERLYTVYNDERLIDASLVHSATLLTNFRCHHALLSLPSYLFYDSSLITAAEAVTHLHPEAKYPLHFICSNLTEEKEIRANSNEFEVIKLLEELSKYVKSWPNEWGKKDLSKICVMTTTAHQKYCVIQALFRYSHLEDIDVRTVFDIQGCEYEAIFLSTAEPTTKEGKSKNPTKTPCSQYVFNTALTRAKSLVVCAGNPFLLMTIEESMGNECSCWKEYIRRCILSKTFVVRLKRKDEANKAFIGDKIKMLQEIIFKLSPASGSFSVKDSILKSFQQALKSIPQYKNCKLRIVQEVREHWNIIDSSSSDTNKIESDVEENEGEKEGVFDCELQIKNYRSAIAIPLDQSKEPIVINGFNNRRGAFNNDIVQVEVTVFNSHSASGDDEAIVKRSGRVLKVIEEQHPTRYVCRADQYGLINFYPLDKTAPVIVNLPIISYNLLRYRPKDDQAPMVHDYIAVFKEESLSVSPNDQIPCIKELIPFELSQSLLFVVEVLGWNPKYRKALGAVIEAVPRTSNLFFTNHLLSLVYNIQEEDEEVHAPLQPPIKPKELRHYNRAFTIDPPLSKDLDDAVSLTPLPQDGNYELAVLIANVAKHINENHPLDMKAKQRGTSVYSAKQSGTSNGIGRVSHMFPSSITSQLSLDHLKERHVLCVPATVVIKEGVVTSVVSGNPREAIVTSQVRFTYESAMKVMHNEEVDDLETRRQVHVFDTTSRPSLLMADTLNLLYKIAMYLRIKRLGDAGYCYGQSEEGEEGNWQTHLLIEELMIFCNATVAEYLHERLPQQTALLRAQMPPLEEEKHNFINQNQNCLSHSLSFKCHLRDSSSEAGPFIMSSTTLQLLIDACSKGDHIQLASILSNNKLYPQLAMAETMSRLISRKASYVVIENSKNHICANHAHNSLALPSYTHFTSPIRRYFDLVVQRLVTSLIEGRPIAENSDLAKLCSQLNVKNKMAKDYERADNKACITRSCEISLEKAEAFVIKSSKKSNHDSFELSFTSSHYECIHGQDTSFSISDLNFHHKIEDGATKSIVWKIVSVSLLQSFSLFSHLDVFDMPPATLKAPHCSIAAKMYQYTQGLEEGEPQLHYSNANFAVRDKDVTFSSERWLVTHQYLKCQNEDNLKKIRSLILQLQQEASKDKPQSKRDEESVAITYEIQRPFIANDTVTVWLGKSLKECLPTPAIQLMEIAPTVRVCLQHNKNPSLCFSDIQLQKASHDTAYHSIEQYVQLWIKVLIAESANESVKTKNLIFIRHAPLKWNKFTLADNCVDDLYYVPEDEVSLAIPPKNQDSLDFISIKSGDFLCVRYEISDSLNAVYHFVVTIVKRHENKKANKKDDEDIVIKMRPHGDYSCRVTENMHQELKKGNQTCEIQLIPMPDSFHRVYERLQEASTEWSNRAKIIAISDTKSKGFNTIAQHCDISLKVFNDDPLAKQLWKGEGGTELNTIQQDSIKRALRNNFQLIQGPPGVCRMTKCDMFILFYFLINWLQKYRKE